MPQAVRRLSFLERRFEKDLKLKEAYSEFLREYLQQGHMKLVKDQNAILAQEHYIIPHQPVVRPDSSMTTRLKCNFMDARYQRQIKITRLSLDSASRK